MNTKFTRSFTKCLASIALVLTLLSNSQTNAQCYTGPIYCIPVTSNTANYGIGIQNVTLGTAINNSTTATGNAPNYFDFTNMAISATAGSVIQFSVKNGNSNSTKAILYIDWNRDGIFDSSSTEMVWASTNTTASAVVSDSFTIPAAQAAGLYRIRVTGDFGGSPSNRPCQNNYGEEEDYSLIITGSAKDGLAKSHISPTNFYVGNDTIRFSMVHLMDTLMTSVDIGYQLDNKTPVTQSLTGLSVPADSIFIATFDTLLTLSAAGTYKLKVWINNVNGGGTVTAGNDTICRTFILCNSALSGSYTIDPNGSGGSNFVNFKEATAALTNCGINGPVVFNVSSDSFYEQVTVPVFSGSSFTNTVNFKGAGKDSTILCFAGTATDPHTVRFNGSRFVNFNNMAIKSSSKTNGWIVHYLNAGKSNLTNCLIDFTDTNTRKSTSQNFAGIVVNGGTSNLYIQASTGNVDSINIDSCTINAGYFNTFFYFSNGVNNALLQLRNNSFTNAYNSSIYINYCQNLCHKILNNYFSLRTGGSNQFGISTSTPAAQSGSLFNEISNNRFTNLNGYGIGMVYWGGANGGAKGQIYNNLFGGNTRGATKYISGSPNGSCCAFYDWNIYHNTFYMDCNTGVSMGIDIGNNTTGRINVKNNLFHNASSTANNVGLNAPNSNGLSIADYNNYYSNYAGGTLAQIGGADYTSTNIIGAYPNGGGLSSSNRNVAFVSSTDYHHSSGCLLGEDGLGVTEDYEGSTHTSPPDMGAYRVSGVSANDVGVSMITSPFFPVSIGSQPLTALVKNYGSDTVSSLTVYYSVNGSTDSETFTFSPALSQCDTISITFTDSISIANGKNAIKVYTAKSGDALVSNDTAQNTYCGAMAGFYTINSSIAPSAANFVSFKAATDQLSCSGVAGPVKFSVSSDTYTEQVNIGLVNGLSSTNTILFIGAGIDSTKITFSGTVNAPQTLRFSKCNNITFRNMTIEGSNANYTWVVNILNSDNIKVAGCRIACVNAAAFSTSQNVAAVVLNGNPTNMTTSGLNNGNYIDSNIIVSGYYGVYTYINTSAYVNYFRNNTFSNAYFAGIYAYQYQTVKILNNTIENRSSNPNSSGINLYFLLNASNNAFNEISGNYINNVGQYGIFLQYSQGGTGNGGVFGEMYNNMVGGNFYSTGATYGIHLYYAPYWKVYHNSVSIASANGSSHRALYVSNYMYKTQIKNNSFAINNASATNSLSMEIVSGSTPDSVNYNNYHNAADTNLVLVKNVTYSTKTYKVAYPNGGGDQSINGDPLYVSANDLHATKTHLLNKGDDVGVTSDIDDDSRSSTPDIGADEYELTKHDLGVNKLLSPSYAFCMGGINQTISMAIKNMGVDTIDLTNDTAWAAVEVYDANQVTTVYGPIAITGKVLYPKDVVNVTVTATFDMSDFGTYYLKPYIGYKLDSNAVNDTIFNIFFDATNPVAILSPIPVKGICGGDSVKMSVANSKNSTEYQWYRNNVAINGAIDTVFYATLSGTYFCDVMVYNGGCQVYTDAVTITTGTAPAATFTAAKTVFCDGDSAKLSSPSNAANSYQWLLNGVGIQGATDSVFYAKATGNYTVQLSETSSGCFNISTATGIIVNSLPTAVISHLGNGTICTGDSLRLSSNPANGLVYQWWMNGNSIGGATDSIYYVSATGSYQLEITNANSCKAIATAAIIYMDSLPTNMVSILGDPTACGMDTVYFSATTNAAFTHQWMRDGNPIAGATSDMLTAFTNGSYTVKITNANGCSSTSANTVIAYRIVPTTPLLNGTAIVSICPSDSMRISVSPQDTGVFTYQWKVNGTTINGGIDSFIYINSNGNYKAEITNNAGCSITSTASIILTLYPTPTTTLSPSGSASICQGDSVSLSVSNAATGIVSLSWTRNGNTLATISNPIYPANSGFYNAHIIDNNGCTSSAAQVAIFVNPSPIPVITPDNNLRQLSTTTFVSYQWYKDNVAIAGATSQIYTTPGNADYIVEVTDGNGCKGKSTVYAVTWHIGIGNAQTNGFVKVYPNPSYDVFNIELPMGTDVKQISLTDIAGKQVTVNAAVNGKNIISLDLTDKAAGVYILQLTKDGHLFQTRLTKL